MVNLAPYSIVLWGSSIPIATDSVSEVTKTSLASTCTDLTSISLSVWGYYEDMKEEGEKIKGAGLIEIDNTFYRESFSIPIEDVLYSDILSSFSSIYTVLNKRYKYLEAVTSPYSGALHSTDSVIAVTVSSKRENKGSYKGLILEMNRRKPLAK